MEIRDCTHSCKYGRKSEKATAFWREGELFRMKYEPEDLPGNVAFENSLGKRVDFGNTVAKPFRTEGFFFLEKEGSVLKKILALVLCAALFLTACSSDLPNEGISGFDDYRKELSAEELEKAMENAKKAENADETVCTVTIVCKTALESGKLSDTMLSLLPADGVLLDHYAVPYQKGDSVFDAIAKAIRENKIHMEYSGTKTVPYIEGVANLYEFDCGSLSGWMYRVNGWFASFGMGQYPLSGGDSIELIYTCDLGDDIGDNYLG